MTLQHKRDMMDNLKKTREMVKGHTLTLMELDIKVNGRII